MPVERTELPANAQNMHPSMLLSLMRPSLQFVDLGTEGTTPKVFHRVGVTFNEEQFFGIGRSKKLARRAVSIDVCNKFFNTTFVRDDPLPIVE